MPFNDAALVIAANAVEAAITHFSLHTAGATSSAGNESAAGRVAVNGSVDADGDITWTGVGFSGGTPNGPVVRVGYWAGETYLGGQAFDPETDDVTFNAAGEYTVDSVTESNVAG